MAKINYLPGDVVIINGNITLDTTTTGVNVLVEIRKLSDDSLVSTVLNSTANFVVGVNRTLYNINGDTNITYTASTVGDYYSKITLSGGTPALDLTLDRDETAEFSVVATAVPIISNYYLMSYTLTLNSSITAFCDVANSPTNVYILVNSIITPLTFSGTGTTYTSTFLASTLGLATNATIQYVAISSTSGYQINDTNYLTIVPLPPIPVPDPPTPPVTGSPGIIGGVQVITRLHDHQYRILWGAESSSTQYNIYRSNSIVGTFTKIVSVLSPITTYTDELPPDFTGVPFYKITGINTIGEGGVTIAQAQTDTTYLSYMKVPDGLNINYYNKDNYSVWMYNVVPTGSINTSNRTFYLNNNYKPGSLEIYKNGFKLEATNFIESGSNFFTVSTTLTVGDTLDCNFIKI